jgi:dienelactone hydrolase
VRSIHACLVFILICAAGAFSAHAQRPSADPPAVKHGPTSTTVASQPQRAQLPSQDTPPDPSLNEEIVRLPLTLMLRDGTTHNSEFVLTTFRPNGPGPFPAVVVSHGRGPNRGAFGRNRFLGAYLTLRGFAVLAPTRIGYGVSGVALDPEGVGGPCDAMDFAPMVEAITAHVRATMAYAAAQPWIDIGNLLLAGESVGGFGSIAAAGELAGVKAVINFAGGTGGSIERPERPCSPLNVELQFARAAGKGGAIPSLWLYSDNDRLWGPMVPRWWHGAYVAAGGTAELHILPPLGEDGHGVVALGSEQWRPLLDRFLTSLGYAPRRLPPGAPRPTGFARLDNVAAVPLVSRKCRKLYATFLRQDVPRAFVIGWNGSCAYAAAQQDVMAKSLAHCVKFAKRACKLYAVNDEVVWKPPASRRRARAAGTAATVPP